LTPVELVPQRPRHSSPLSIWEWTPCPDGSFRSGGCGTNWNGKESRRRHFMSSCLLETESSKWSSIGASSPRRSLLLEPCRLHRPPLPTMAGADTAKSRSNRRCPKRSVRESSCDDPARGTEPELARRPGTAFTHGEPRTVQVFFKCGRSRNGGGLPPSHEPG
jgi:hypothetical protein